MKTSKLAKNTLLLSIGTLITNVLQFIMVPLFSRWLTTSDYGMFDLCVTYVSLMLPIVNLATGEAVFRFSIDSNGKQQKSIISNGLMIVLLNSFVITCILLIIYWFTRRYILLSFLLLLLAQVLNSYGQSFLRGIKKLKIYSLTSIFTTIFISIFVTFFVWKLKWELNGIILGYAMGYFIGDVLLFTISNYNRYFSMNEISVHNMFALIKYSYPLIPNNICWWVINTSDRLVINTFLGSAANGVYAIAHKVPNVCSSIFGMFNISWQESASEVVESNKRNTYYNNVYNNTIAVLISLCTGVLSLNFILFDFLFDVKYENAGLYMPILVIAILFSSLSQFYGGIMISMKMPKANGSTTILGAAINLVIHIILIKWIGLYASALSTMISNMSLCFIRKWYLRKKVKCKVNQYIYIYSVIFVYMFCMSYIEVGYGLRIANVIIACILVVFVNKTMILSLLGRVKVLFHIS